MARREELEELIDGWRMRLAESRARACGGAPHRRWLWLAYARVYRFLLARYGSAEEGAEASFAAPPWGPSGPVLGASPASSPSLGMDFPRVRESRPLKPLGKVQAVLKDVHNANARGVAPGPLAEGLPGDAWLAVAARREGWNLHSTRIAFQDRGILARVAWVGSDWVVEVARADFSQAVALLARKRRELVRDRRTGKVTIRVAAARRKAAWGILAGTSLAIGWLASGEIPTAAIASAAVLLAFTVYRRAGRGRRRVERERNPRDNP